MKKTLIAMAVALSLVLVGCDVNDWDDDAAPVTPSAPGVVIVDPTPGDPGVKPTPGDPGVKPPKPAVSRRGDGSVELFDILGSRDAAAGQMELTVATADVAAGRAAIYKEQSGMPAGLRGAIILRMTDLNLSPPRYMKATVGENLSVSYDTVEGQQYHVEVIWGLADDTYYTGSLVSEMDFTATGATTVEVVFNYDANGNYVTYNDDGSVASKEKWPQYVVDVYINGCYNGIPAYTSFALAQAAESVVPYQFFYKLSDGGYASQLGGLKGTADVIAIHQWMAAYPVEDSLVVFDFGDAFDDAGIPR